MVGEEVRLVFASTTPLAGMPWRTMKVCDRYLRENGGGWARSIVGRTGYGGEREYPHDLVVGDPECQSVIEEADVGIVTAYMPFSMWGIDRNQKPVARHLSTEPWRWADKNPSPENHTVVAQYQHRFAKDCTALPNCIPIDDPMFSPGEKPKDVVRIVYSPTNRHHTTDEHRRWGNKGFTQTIATLKKLQVRYRDLVDIVVLEHRPYEEVMRARRESQIVIDECVTGSYHSTALEGLACGAVSICWMDMQTENAWCTLHRDQPAALESLPFTVTPMNQLFEVLQSLVENPDMLQMRCKAARRWMQANYSEAWQANSWLTWHRDFLTRRRSTAKS